MILFRIGEYSYKISFKIPQKFQFDLLKLNMVPWNLNSRFPYIWQSKWLWITTIDWKLQRKFTFKPRSRCCRVVGFRKATFKCVNFTSLCDGFLYHRLVLWLNLRSRRLDVTAQERTGRTRETRDSFSPRVFSSSASFFFMPITFRLTCRPCDVSHWTAQKSQTKPCKNIIYCKTSQKVHATTQN